MKSAIAVVGLFLVTGLAFGQKGKYGATPEDSVKCVQSLIYKDFIKEKDYDKALPLWRIAYTVCPQSQKTLYTNGVKMYRAFIKREQDEAKKQALVDTLMTIYDQRIEYFGEKCKVLGFKGQDLFRYRSKTHAEEANKILKEAIDGCGEKSGAGTLLSYYQSLYKMFGEKKIEKAPLLEEYLMVSGHIATNIKGGKDTKGYFQKAQNNIDAIFGKVAKCEDIIKVFGEKVAAEPDNVELKKTGLALLEKGKCADSEEFGNWAKAVYEVEPSEDAAVNIAKWEIARKNFSSALKYLDKAIEQCADCESKVDYHVLAAQCALSLSQTSTAKKHARAILAKNPQSGQAYILIGKATAAYSKQCGKSELENKSVYWVAVDYFNKAKSVDSSVADEANKLIATYSKYFPTKAMAFQYGFKDGDSYTVECLGETTTVRVI